jgi:signal transduction histidine kinase
MGAHPVPGEFDHDRMLQVLGNLISNSIKFTGPGGKIAVGAERADDELRFCVSDTGAGIPEDSLEAIFERFWQVGRNDRRGLGLGLYISKCIVEAHGGRIWAESTRGEGTTVCFSIRAAAGMSDRQG